MYVELTGLIRPANCVAAACRDDDEEVHQDQTHVLGVRHAYTFDVNWTNVDQSDTANQLRIIGDCDNCRMALVNDCRDWQDPRDWAHTSIFKQHQMEPCPLQGTADCQCHK